jgi:hypothetical protein
MPRSVVNQTKKSYGKRYPIKVMKSIFLIIFGTQWAQSAVVVDTNISLESPAVSLGFEYSFTVEQYRPPGGNTTSIFFDRSAQNLIYRTRNLDGGSFWYFAELNDRFTPESIAEGEFLLFNQRDQSFEVPYGNFYFGVRTFSDFGEDIQGFGWALLNHSEEGLTLLASAITHEQPGIIIGTTTTIPEPGPITLLMTAFANLALKRRRRVAV